MLAIHLKNKDFSFLADNFVAIDLDSLNYLEIDRFKLKIQLFLSKFN